MSNVLHLASPRRLVPRALRWLALLSLVAPTMGCAGTIATANPAPPRLVRIVAAENFYGDVATQIGGDRVSVVSILKDPNVDPHEYESNVDDAKAVADAGVVIKNGLGYDAFVDRLLAASPRPQRVVIDVSQLTGHPDGDNPHLWYDPTTMPKVAQTLSETLTRLDPTDQAYFAQRLQVFNRSEKAVIDQVAAMKAKDTGTKVLATEPVFDYMADALGLSVVDKEGAFQKAVEEGNDPPASTVAQFRAEIASHGIQVLIYNSQAVTPITNQMLGEAKRNRVPVVPISETEPAGKTYQQWMLDQLKTLQQEIDR